MSISQAAVKESRTENFSWEGLDLLLELTQGVPSLGMNEAHSQAKTGTEQEKPKVSASCEAESLLKVDSVIKYAQSPAPETGENKTAPSSCKSRGWPQGR